MEKWDIKEKETTRQNDAWNEISKFWKSKHHHLHYEVSQEDGEKVKFQCLECDFKCIDNT